VAIVDSYPERFPLHGGFRDVYGFFRHGGGTGNNASGPWKIEGNFLEAAGENILFGAQRQPSSRLT